MLLRTVKLSILHYGVVADLSSEQFVALNSNFTRSEDEAVVNLVCYFNLLF